MRRKLLSRVLVLIAELDGEAPDAPVGARRAARLVARRRDQEAIATLSAAGSDAIAATGRVLESCLD